MIGNGYAPTATSSSRKRIVQSHPSHRADGTPSPAFHDQSFHRAGVPSTGILGLVLGSASSFMSCIVASGFKRHNIYNMDEKGFLLASLVLPSLLQPMGLAAIKKEFAELWEVVREMERLSQRKPRINERVEQYRNHLQQCGEDIPLCHKIFNTVKLVAEQLARDCQEVAV
jgi:hypothetical protein